MLRYAGDWYGCRDVVFELAPDVTVGVEICEDVWVADPPSVTLAKGRRDHFIKSFVQR